MAVGGAFGMIGDDQAPRRQHHLQRRIQHQTSERWMKLARMLDVVLFPELWNARTAL